MLTMINGKVVPGPEIGNSVKQNMVRRTRARRHYVSCWGAGLIVLPSFEHYEL